MKIAAKPCCCSSDLEARLDEKRRECSLTGELSRAAAEIRVYPHKADDYGRALEAVHAAALAEIENKAQAHIRALRDQLVDAEAALAKSRKERSDRSWTRRFSLSKVAPRRAPVDEQRSVRRRMVSARISGRRRKRPLAGRALSGGRLFARLRPNPLFDTRWYLERYEDVRRAGINPLSIT